MGSLIDFFDRKLNRPNMQPGQKRGAGLLALIILVCIIGGIALALTYLTSLVSYGFAIIAAISATHIAQRSLAAHVGAVAIALEQQGLGAGREAVSRIVGRETAELDQSGISRAAIESLAENFSDGVVAPTFWLAIAGLPGIAIYKAINTADSMIGHRSDRYVDFGWATARIDDFVNLPASRLSALMVIIAAFLMPGTSAKRALQAVRRDARHHRSPNAGWPEAAFAGALGLELAGPRQYGDEIVNDAIMGVGGKPNATAADIRRALRLFWFADMIMIALLGIAVALIYMYY